jgi:hypothetical protein
LGFESLLEFLRVNRKPIFLPAIFLLDRISAEKWRAEKWQAEKCQLTDG